MPNNRLILVLGWLLPALASAQAPRVRDSAGVHIVENSARSKSTVVFRLSEKPSYDIGGLKTDPADELNPRGGYLRSIVLSNGTHVVADNDRLRYYDATGRQLRVTGRNGAGPGEFRQISTLCHARGDTVVASDPNNARVTIFDKNGSIVRQVPVGYAGMPHNGCLDDGTWVLHQTLAGTDAIQRARMVRYNLDGKVVGSAGEYWDGKFDMFISVNPTYAVRGTHLYVGDPRASEVRIYDSAGKLTGIIRTDDPIEKTTAAERDAMTPQVFPRTDDKAVMDRFKERLRTTPRPAEWPSYGRIEVDPDGRLWIQDYHKVRTDPELWAVFDVAGRLLGTVSFPAALKPGDPRITSFTSGGVEMRREDTDGAVHLTTYPLLPMNRRP